MIQTSTPCSLPARPFEGRPGNCETQDSWSDKKLDDTSLDYEDLNVSSRSFMEPDMNSSCVTERSFRPVTTHLSDPGAQYSFTSIQAEICSPVNKEGINYTPCGRGFTCHSPEIPPPGVENGSSKLYPLITRYREEADSLCLANISCDAVVDDDDDEDDDDDDTDTLRICYEDISVCAEASDLDSARPSDLDSARPSEIDSAGPIDRAGQNEIDSSAPSDCAEQSDLDSAGPRNIDSAGPSDCAGPSDPDSAGPSDLDSAGPSDLDSAGPTHSAGPRNIDSAGPSDPDSAGPSDLDSENNDDSPGMNTIVENNSVGLDAHSSESDATGGDVIKADVCRTSLDVSAIDEDGVKSTGDDEGHDDDDEEEEEEASHDTSKSELDICELQLFASDEEADFLNEPIYDDG